MKLKQQLLQLIENDAEVNFAFAQYLGIKDIEQDIKEIRRIEQKIPKEFLNTIYDNKTKIQEILDIDDLEFQIDQIKKKNENNRIS